MIGAFRSLFFVSQKSVGLLLVKCFVDVVNKSIKSIINQ